jgi:probable rRNA maturation factor
VGDWILGELFISVEKAAKQAEEYGHSMRRELAFLFAHGLLHVLGFDHETGVGEKEMFGYQNKILELTGINR